MNIFLSIVGFVLAVVGVGVKIYTAYGEKEYGDKFPKVVKTTAQIFAVVGFIVFILGATFKIVPTGYTGVRTTFGQISEQTVEKGFNLKIPFVQKIELVNNKQEDTTIEAKVWGETSEKTPVFASDIVVTSQINPEKSAWLYANVTDVSKLLEEKVVSSAVKSAMVKMSVKNVTVRDKIEPAVKECLQQSLDEKYGEGTIRVHKVTINNMDFEDSYNEAIAAKSIAQQAYEKQKIENETAISKAEADKKVSITKAEATAEAKLIKAEAEAKANKLLEKSLTDGVLQSKFYEEWNGVLPSVMGEGAVITDIGQINGQTN